MEKPGLPSESRNFDDCRKRDVPQQICDVDDRVIKVVEERGRPALLRKIVDLI